MKKVAGAAPVGLAGLVLCFLVWGLGKIEPGRESGELQFKHSTSSDYNAVRECVKFGSGSDVFYNYKQVFIAPYGPAEALDASTYIDATGSSLIIQRMGGRTVVQLKSDRPLSDEQKDLLEWCLLNPQLTWIPPEIRSK